MNCFFDKLFIKCQQIRRKLPIFSDLLKTNLTENLFFMCSVKKLKQTMWNVFNYQWFLDYFNDEIRIFGNNTRSFTIFLQKGNIRVKDKSFRKFLD